MIEMKDVKALSPFHRFFGGKDEKEIIPSHLSFWNMIQRDFHNYVQCDIVKDEYRHTCC